MISHARFGRLRLAKFRPDAAIAALADWEFMDAVWVGEAVGFSEWLRLKSDPNVLRSLAVDFAEFPEAAASEVLAILGLPLRRGMTAKELRASLGEPIKEHRFAPDRDSYEFTISGPPRYNVSCTVLKRGGLIYLVVMRPARERRHSAAKGCRSAVVKVDGRRITDWESFHEVFADVFGFPEFYGRNMNAWIDCLTSLDEPDDGMTKVHAPPGGIVVLQLDGVADFARRCPEQYEAVVECAAFVNWRKIAVGARAVLALSFHKDADLVDSSDGDPRAGREG